MFLKSKINTGPVEERIPNERGLRAIENKAFDICFALHMWKLRMALTRNIIHQSTCC